MRSDGLTNFLLVVLAICVVATSAVCFGFVQATRKAHRLQAEVGAVNRNRAMAQALAADVFDYSKRNPAVLPILQTIGIRTNAPETATTPSKTR